jgi:hypothetical protein
VEGIEMKKKKILICDDVTNVRQLWKKTLEQIPFVKRHFEIQILGDQFGDTLKALEKRRREARETKKHSKWKTNIFDSASILIVDYDLLDFSREDYITGEGVAYLARCYSRCGLIIALNQFGVNSFDLTLKSNPDSFADLNLGSDQLDNPGLWVEPWNGFRPWHWPLLPAALEAFERRVRELKGNLDRSVLGYLGFKKAVSEALPRSTREFLGSGDKPETVKFREFVQESGKGLQRKDRAADDESLARIAAARVAKWLERLVVSGQEVLVDAPHLIARFPSLLNGQKGRIETWNKTASLKGITSLGIRQRQIADFRFQKDNWVSRPVWFWKALSNLEDIEEVADPWSTETRDFVFCEDVSKFLPSEETREFVADLASPFVRRFVADHNPKALKRLGSTLKKVEYVPAVRFSL